MLFRAMAHFAERGANSGGIIGALFVITLVSTKGIWSSDNGTTYANEIPFGGYLGSAFLGLMIGYILGMRFGMGEGAIAAFMTCLFPPEKRISAFCGVYVCVICFSTTFVCIIPLFAMNPFGLMLAVCAALASAYTGWSFLVSLYTEKSKRKPK